MVDSKNGRGGDDEPHAVKNRKSKRGMMQPEEVRKSNVKLYHGVSSNPNIATFISSVVYYNQVEGDIMDEE